ncbi:MAG TPA: acyltransferase family protein [Solirubrobacteraceae bacterium]|nr:acyltransferase family protein [Solirubrobacteraceae bacterium]
MSVREPRRRPFQLGHHPGLDGLRGLAVAAVVLYHGGLSWIPGGFIGVELFFVLSGFLITSLLVGEWRRSGTIALGGFWARRARRLLPALLLLVAAIGIYYGIAGPTHAIPGLKDDGLATLLYVGNWHQIAAGSSYFAASGPVSPLQHTWSLAIEEQFYLVWPLLVLGLLRLLGRGAATAAGRTRALRGLLLLSVGGALASATEMALRYDGGRGVDRVYYGTDTRAFSLLIGASLAITLALHRPDPDAAAVRRLRRAAAPALALVAAAIVLAAGGDAWLYPYGFVAIDLATITVIATIVLAPRAVVARILSVGVLRRLGAISYGLYLWHFPLFQWLDQTSTGLTGTPLLALRLAAAIGASTLSYVLVEQPIRQRRLPRWTVHSLTPVAAGGALACLLVGSAVSSISFTDAAAKSLPKPPARLAGHDGPCPVSLTDTTSIGEAPLPLATATKTEYEALGDHALTWKGSSTVSFRTCPPAKVLVVGDSLGYTIGVGLMENEQRYGLQVDNAAILGCAFDATGEMQISGVWQAQSTGCPDALTTWAADANAVGARAVVVELGYRDQFNWKIDGKVEHLGQTAFDARLQRTIDRYVQVLGAHGRDVVFLSVPWSKPPANPDGSASVAGTPARHRTINAMLAKAARGHANVSIVDLDATVSPHGEYQPDVNGKLCRFDGVHFTLYCSQLLQPTVLGDVRRQLAG